MERPPRYGGIDLHRNCFTVYPRQADGRGTQRTWRSTALAAGAVTVQATDAVAVEATGNTRWFGAALHERGCKLVGGTPPVRGDQPVGAGDRGPRRGDRGGVSGE